ncbi:response regulator receiver domain [Mailhella sp.]
MSSFATYSEASLKAFLRTAIVIDDHMDFGSSEKFSIIKTPSRRMADLSPSAESPAVYQEGYLNASALVESFLKEGILCTPLERTSGFTEDEEIPVADIFVLDWKFGDNGNNAISCIEKCTKGHPRAVHFICIYTSEIDVSKISDMLIDHFRDITELECNKENGFKINNTYIIIYKKRAPNANLEGLAPFKEVQEEDLPRELIKTFSQLLGGLLPNTVLNALGAIRDNTHSLLSRFPASLDYAFLTHRACSNPCEDTEEHIIPIICSEVRSVLLQNNIASCLNIEKINSWIADNPQNITPLKKLKKEKDGKEEEYLPIFLETGMDGLCKEHEYHRICKDILEKHVRNSELTEFWGARNPRLADAELAMLMAYEYKYEDCIPLLQSGTIIKASNSALYYLCVQPACDCVRIESTGRPFLFIPLEEAKDADRFDFVFIDGEMIKYLKKITKIYKLKIIEFAPKDGDKNISSYIDEEGRTFFKGADEEKYFFVLQLKEAQTLRSIQESANALSRIGLTESEWLRRCSR